MASTSSHVNLSTMASWSVLPLVRTSSQGLASAVTPSCAPRASSAACCFVRSRPTPLLANAPYRPPDVYQVSKDVVGAVAQVQKTAYKALRLVTGELHRLYRDDGAPTDIEISTIRPRQVLVIGSLSEFADRGGANAEKITSFEQYRRSIQDVEVITFDELYERACFIVKDY
ncbi:Shedu anti-phage system protein SduA domain-containing protein [Streptomyces anulatus]